MQNTFWDSRHVELLSLRVQWSTVPRRAMSLNVLQGTVGDHLSIVTLNPFFFAVFLRGTLRARGSL
eukprot:242050-Pyramimonas_sp.AAC.1